MLISLQGFRMRMIQEKKRSEVYNKNFFSVSCEILDKELELVLISGHLLRRKLQTKNKANKLFETSTRLSL